MKVFTSINATNIVGKRKLKYKVKESKRREEKNIWVIFYNEQTPSTQYYKIVYCTTDCHIECLSIDNPVKDSE